MLPRSQPAPGSAAAAVVRVLAPSGPASARLTVTHRARRAVARIRRSSGPQALLLSWPGGATCLPIDAFEPEPYDVIIGHVAGCAIHADLRQLNYYRDRAAVLDTVPDTSRTAPILLLRRALARAAMR